MGPTMETLFLAALAGGGAIGLAAIAAAVIGRGAEERDLAGRLRAVIRPGEQLLGPGRGSRGGAAALARPFRRLGEVLRGAAVVSDKDIAEFQRQMAAAGFNPRAAVPTFSGVKATLLVAMPLVGLLYALAADYGVQGTALAAFGGLVAAVLGPNIALGMLRRPFETKLRKGLPDALDLLVVTAEAGLGLESALDRVVREIRHSNPAIALEINVLVQELRMMPDRRVALERFAERSGVEGCKRLGATLSQTLRYGTPLAQALRTLAAEMRAERMLRIEEKAIRLPALLVIPLIVFIMPSVFIALVGPSVLELTRNMSNFGGAN